MGAAHAGSGATGRVKRRRALILSGTAVLALAGSDGGLTAKGKGVDTAGGEGLLAALRPALVQVGWGQPVGEALAVHWLGTGFLVDKKCTIATAKHILKNVDPSMLIVNLQHPREPGRGASYPATVEYANPVTDLAFLRVAGLPGITRDLPPIIIAQSSSLGPHRHAAGQSL